MGWEVSLLLRLLPYSFPETRQKGSQAGKRVQRECLGGHVSAPVLWPILAMLLEVSSNFELSLSFLKGGRKFFFFFVSFNVTPLEVYSQRALPGCPEISD